MENQSTTNAVTRTENGPTVRIARLRFEQHRENLGIGEARPRLSWTVETATEGWRQSAYEIEAYGSNDQLRAQTGRVERDQSVLVDWPFAPLTSRERVGVRVRVWGNDTIASAWSEPVMVEAGLIAPEDWSAHFVTPDWDEDTSRPQPAPLLRRAFAVRPGVARARLYVTAQGVYEAEINGACVGDHLLAPGWTSYNHRLRYQTFDVTELLREGPNVLGAMLGDGWFRGRLSFGGGRRNNYGDRLALLAQLEITYADGSVERVLTDERWRASTGPLLASDIYDGETYDARLEKPGWAAPGFDDRDWAGVRLLKRERATLVAPVGPPVRAVEELEPVAITTSPSGRTIVDFGQNLVGWVRLSVQGPAGQTITLRHAEVLEHGELCTAPLRTAAATDRYTLRGGEVEAWAPRFTFHGFRYVEVEGWPGELHAGALRAVVVHSDMERTGWFECSEPLVNRLHENVVWGMRGNFLDVPTDCPQRDERLGWTGDIQAFAPTAAFVYDTAGMLHSWLQDLAVEQQEKGVVPFVVPDVMGMPNPPTAAWGDAAVFVPWALFQAYGDLGVLAAQWDSMRAWVDQVAAIAGERRLWNTGYQFGDWLDPAAPAENPGAGRTNPSVVATAYFARSAELLGQTAQALGKSEEAAHYLALAAEVRAAFSAEYVTPNGLVISDSPTAYALALQFALLPDATQRAHAGARLAALVRESGYHISTGFVGTPLICDALCSVGADDAAYRLLLQRECPSWLYPVTMGATTIWERWDSMRPDGTVNPSGMTSFNHYALGAVADWLHRTVAGLAPDEPGYRRLRIQPMPGGGLTRASARHHTPYGLAEVTWQLEAGQLTVTAMVPPNATARVFLPGGNQEPLEVGAGRHRWTYPYQDAVAARPTLTLDSTFNQLIDNAEAFGVVKAIMLRHMPELAQHMEAGASTQGQGDTTLRHVMALIPNSAELSADLEAALRELRQ